MNFLHPMFLAFGAAAVAVPIAVHFLTRPRPKKMPLSTIRFVRQAVNQKGARRKLRDWLVLLLRAAAVALLGWAFARPLTGAKPLVNTSAPGNAVRVVILDCSQSMAAVANGQTVFDRGRAAAGRYLRYDNGLRADLLLAAARPNAVFELASTNFGAIGDALKSAAPLPQGIDVQAAVNRAARVFATSPHTPDARLELVVVSDFQRTSWSRVDFSPLPKDVVIEFESATVDKPIENTAITRVEAVGRVEADREIRLEAEVGNFGRTPRNVTVDVTLGAASCRMNGLCPPGVRTTLTGSVVLPTPGWVGGRARIDGPPDALPADDVRPLVVEVRRPPVYGLITKDSATPHASSSHFMERALVPIVDKTKPSAERVVRVDPSRPDLESLSTADVLVLDHPGLLSREVIDQLASVARRGKGLLYVAADPVDATNLKAMADVAGSDLKLPVEFQPPTEKTSRSDLFLLEWNKTQPPFRNILPTMTAAAAGLRFNGGLPTRRLESGLIDDVLATYGDRSAALVVTPLGAGTLAVLNVDLVTSNLPASPVFVPMIGELCGRLLSGNRSAAPTACGEPFTALLPATVVSIEGLQIDGPAADQSLAQEGRFVVWKAESAGPPGVYLVKKGDAVVFAAATATPAGESDLTPIDPTTLKTRLAAGRTVDFKSASDEPLKDQRWAWFMVACVTCLVVELGVLRAFKT